MKTTTTRATTTADLNINLRLRAEVAQRVGLRDLRGRAEEQKADTVIRLRDDLRAAYARCSGTADATARAGLVVARVRAERERVWRASWRDAVKAGGNPLATVDSRLRAAKLAWLEAARVEAAAIEQREALSARLLAAVEALKEVAEVNDLRTQAKALSGRRLGPPPPPPPERVRVEVASERDPSFVEAIDGLLLGALPPEPEVEEAPVVGAADLARLKARFARR